MQQQLLSTSLYQIGYDPKKSAMHLSWTEESSSMSHHEFKGVILEAKRLIAEMRPKFFIINKKSFQYELKPFMLTFMKEDFCRGLRESGVVALSLVYERGNEGYIKKISSMIGGKQLPVHCFKSMKQAYQHLKS